MNEKTENVIAIDGPAGSGKSTIAREVGKILGYEYLDTGAFYRTVTLFFLEKYHADTQGKRFSDWLEIYPFRSDLQSLHIDCKFNSGSANTMLLNDRDVSEAIRTPEVTDCIKYLAGIAEVRDRVNLELRELAKRHKLIMDGRDIGTVVFPEARNKYFLTASLEERSKRRQLDFKSSGREIPMDELMKDIALRDQSDSERELAPLKQAEDAILIDTTGLSKDIVIKTILSGIKNRD